MEKYTLSENLVFVGSNAEILSITQLQNPDRYAVSLRINGYRDFATGPTVAEAVDAAAEVVERYIS